MGADLYDWDGDLEPWYSIHLMALAAGELATQADIAAALAVRDRRISALEDATDAA